ncbi:flagellar basal body P-ring formation chaperone FlgA [Acidipila rosea]|uniref:Flagellar basal body P-ring formation chaperone FlgA n=2 Tax=Acidipila rosea TaxID=768535 RepID=A0A4R1LDA7_9BACT|nr:flagellar basal body P-ring formation chaperone FlgA [Acidipila rosea]
MRASLLSCFLVMNCLPLAASTCSGSFIERRWMDATLHRKWAVVADCDHPAQPWRIIDEGSGVALTAQSRNTAPEVLPARKESPRIAPVAALELSRVIRAGSAVELWKQNGDTRIELSGTAVESGDVGSIIRVRISGSVKQLHGIVRGPGSVELSPNAVSAWGQP